MIDSIIENDIAAATKRVRDRYVAANPKSKAAQEAARAVFPAGNTRATLGYQPFPLTIANGVGAEVEDADGHAYVDCVGEYSAGLFGHSNPTIRSAIVKALDAGIVLGGPNLYETRFAAAICNRFPSIELVRFCNSGTEANTLALLAARAFTKRKKILVFNDAYHGGFLAFKSGGGGSNLPFDFVMADYNDPATEGLMRKFAPDLAAVIIEPIIGAGGNICATPEFIRMLRTTSSEIGAVLIFDEVKTSRNGPGGMQKVFGIIPDMTTLGKYIGGGLTTGAFGGRRDIMEIFDPAKAGTLVHSGTFNNNVCSMAAGVAAMTEVFTCDEAARFFARGEAFRIELNTMLAQRNVPLQFTGLGSIMAPHFTTTPILGPKDVPKIDKVLMPLMHMEMLMRGVLVAARGDIFLSLPMEKRHFDKIKEALMGFVDEHESLIASSCPPATSVP
jgi:glutamate-1-semialdehyde 2,1-aminomutase